MTGWIPNVVAGQPILSADWGNPIRDRTVTPFASTVERDTAIPAPTLGMVCYIAAAGGLQVYDGTAWRALGQPRGIIASGANVPTPALNALLNLSNVLAGPPSWLAANTITLPAGADGLYLIQLDVTYRSDAVAGIYWEIANGAGAAYAPDMRCNIAHTVSTIAARYQSSWLRQCAAGEGFQVRYRGNAQAGANFMQVMRLSLVRLGDALSTAATAALRPGEEAPDVINPTEEVTP
jgi:hypothetical protein